MDPENFSSMEQISALKGDENCCVERQRPVYFTLTCLVFSFTFAMLFVRQFLMGKLFHSFSSILLLKFFFFNWSDIFESWRHWRVVEPVFLVCGGEDASRKGCLPAKNQPRIAAQLQTELVKTAFRCPISSSWSTGIPQQRQRNAAHPSPVTSDCSASANTKTSCLFALKIISPGPAVSFRMTSFLQWWCVGVRYFLRGIGFSNCWVLAAFSKKCKRFKRNLLKKNRHCEDVLKRTTSTSCSNEKSTLWLFLRHFVFFFLFFVHTCPFCHPVFNTFQSQTVTFYPIWTIFPFFS